jgi:hypothetical protein
VTAQLIAAEDGSHLFSERYEREMADVFAMQDEIAVAVTVPCCCVRDTSGYTTARSGDDSRECCELWPECQRGGMAERSMAVVLKTGRIGYGAAVIFRHCVARSHL